MKVCVLGAGVVGLTTAWALREAGADVIVLDRHPTVAAGTSHGNGAQLSYSYVAPLASFGTLRNLPKLLLAANSPMRFRPRPDLDFLRWSVRFLAACNADAEAATTVALLRLGALSRQVLAEWTERDGLEFGLGEAGKLVIHRTERGLAGARRQAEFQARNGGAAQHVLSGAESVARASALKLEPSDLAGGIFTPSEQVADCGRFCALLADRMALDPSVDLRLATTIMEPVVRKGRLVAVQMARGAVEANAFVLALGAESGGFAAKAGLHLPVYPLKGYSITARQAANAPQLACSVTDADRKIVLAPVRTETGSVIRAAGIVDLAGYDLRCDPRRLAVLTGNAEALIDLDREDGLQPWTGLRPATPSGRPVLGRSPVAGLYVNAGHGSLGWTLACGSARLLSELVCGRPLSLDPALFTHDL